MNTVWGITRAGVAAVGIGIAAATLTACQPVANTASGSTGGSTPTTSSSTAGSVSTQPSTGTTATASAPGGNSPAPAGPAACPTRSLQAKIGVSQGTAGSVYTVLDFKNISNATCTLYGYPGVSLAGGTPVTQIGLAAKESNTAPRTLVTLAPGATGNALLQIVDAGNFPAATCDPVSATYLQIYPPNQTTPIYLSYTTQTCKLPVQTLTIGVVQPGSGSAS